MANATNFYLGQGEKKNLAKMNHPIGLVTSILSINYNESSSNNGDTLRKKFISTFF